MSSTSTTDIADNTVTIIATLNSYPTVTGLTVALIVTFADCIVTGISVTTPMATAVTYIVGNIATSIKFAVYT